MHLNPFMAVLGLSGGELIIILISLFVMVALPVAAIVIIVWLWKRHTPSGPVPPVMPFNTKRICPQCRNEMAPDAPQGLCPQCLARAAFETRTAEGSERPPAALPVSEIAKSFPQFEIIELLGQGGMGVVYKARQPQLDRFVALKILSPALSRDPAFAERFTREARALARLNHPNIVAVYESGKAGDFYYLVMEFVDGLNLSQMQIAKKRIAPEEAFAIVPRICDALQYAHDEGVVHRDIKPANILIDKKGRVKIADFGLAKIAGREVTGLGLTQTHAMMGTPQYMAPEQLERPLEVDHRADIYSLGVVFYEMLTGELPLGRFPSPSQKVQIDVRLDEIVLRTLEKEPGLRYQQASQVKTAVETVVSTPDNAAHSSASSPPREVPPLAAQPKNVAGKSWEPSVEAGVNAKLSRSAIIGAVWAALFAMMVPVILIPFFWHTVSMPISSPASIEPTWRFALRSNWVLGLFTFTAPFGVTICGWVAIFEIRRSAGRIYGLGLAMFDALLFPMLVVAGIIFFGWFVGFKLFAMSPVMPEWLKNRGGDHLLTAIWVGLSIVTCAPLIFLICRKVWRAVKTPNGAPPLQSPKRQFGWWPVVGISILALGIVAIALLLVIPNVVHVTKVNHSMAQPQTEFAKVRCRVFEADAKKTDAAIPRENRSVAGTNAAWQIAELSDEMLTALTNAMSPNPGLLAENRQTIHMWPRQSFSISYSRANDLSGGGNVSGFFGVRSSADDFVFRTEFNVNHNLNPQSSPFPKIRASIRSTNIFSTSANLAVLIPSVRSATDTRYLVVAFEVDHPRPDNGPISIGAIGQPDRWPYTWWDKNGNPVAMNEEWLKYSATSAFAVVVNSKDKPRILDVDVKLPKALQFGSGAASGGDFGCILYFNDNSSGDLRRYLSEGGSVDVSVKYGTGQWQEVTQIQAGTTLTTNGGEFRFKQAEPLGQDAVIADCDYDFDPKYEVTIVGVDNEGNWSRNEADESSGFFHIDGREGRHFYGTIQFPKTNIAHFLILKRLLQERVFSNIQTKPFGTSELTRPALRKRIAETTDDLRAKLKLALSMTTLSTRDEAIAVIAKEAALARDTALAREAIQEISIISTSDGAAVECARTFLKCGMRKEALEMAEMISTISVHDETIKELLR